MDAPHDEDFISILEALSFRFFANHILDIVDQRADDLQLPSDDSLDAGFINILAKYILTNMITSLINKIREQSEENVTDERSNETEIANSMAKKSDGYIKASYGHYSWLQTISDMDVDIQIDENLTSRQLLVEVTSTTILIKSRVTGKIYLEGDLCKKCKATETIWVMDGSELQIYLTKTAECWWNCLFQSEKKLDVK